MSCDSLRGKPAADHATDKPAPPVSCHTQNASAEARRRISPQIKNAPTIPAMPIERARGGAARAAVRENRGFPVQNCKSLASPRGRRPNNRANDVTARARGDTKRARGEAKRARRETARARADTKRAWRNTARARADTKRAWRNTARARGQTRRARRDTARARDHTRRARSETAPSATPPARRVTPRAPFTLERGMNSGAGGDNGPALNGRPGARPSFE